jgi:hypothetical protein
MSDTERGDAPAEDGEALAEHRERVRAIIEADRELLDALDE